MAAGSSGKESRWVEVRAALAWAVQSWARPAGWESRWEQAVGREELAWEHTLGASGGERPQEPQDEGGNRPSRQESTKVQGTGM